jgi:hypothetical protein
MPCDLLMFKSRVCMAHGCGCHQSKALCEAGAKCSPSTSNMCVPLPYPPKQVCFFLFFPLNFWCFHIDDHSQADLAMCGYRAAMKVEICWNIFISWLLAWTMCRKMVKFLDLKRNSWMVLNYFGFCLMTKIHHTRKTARNPCWKFSLFCKG